MRSRAAGPGRVVVVPTLTFAASANAVVHAGATPVFVDALEQTATSTRPSCWSFVDALRADGADVAAVMTVDLFGRVADHAALEPELAARGIPLVEDAAESLGATRDGRSAGSFGRAAALSFNGNKIMTTSGGGMLLSDDETLVARARYLATQARQPVPWYEHTEIGFNYRLSNLLGALGRAQLSRLDEMTARRRAHRERYASGLADLLDLRLLGRGGEPGDETRQLLADRARPRPVPADDARRGDRGPGRRSASRRGTSGSRCTSSRCTPVTSAAVTGVAERLFDRGVVLPSGSALRDGDIDRVVEALHEVLR